MKWRSKHILCTLASPAPWWQVAWPGCSPCVPTPAAAAWASPPTPSALSRHWLRRWRKKERRGWKRKVASGDISLLWLGATVFRRCNGCTYNIDLHISPPGPGRTLRAVSTWEEAEHVYTLKQLTTSSSSSSSVELLSTLCTAPLWSGSSCQIHWGEPAEETNHKASLIKIDSLIKAPI